MEKIIEDQIPTNTGGLWNFQAFQQHILISGGCLLAYIDFSHIRYYTDVYKFCLILLYTHQEMV